MTDFENALVIRSGAVGDFIFTLPALAALRQASPNAHISVMGHPEMLALVDGRCYADDIYSIDKAEVATLFSKTAQVAPSLAHRLSQYDLIIAYLSDADGILRENLSSVCNGRVVLFSPILPENGQTHIVDHLLKPIKSIGIKVIDMCPVLRLSSEDCQAGSRLLQDLGIDLNQNIVAVHPGAGSPAKCWPADRYARLIDDLAAYCTVLVVTGPADSSTTETVLGLVDHGDKIVRLERMSLLTVTQALACCSAYIGNDSGITHVAAALEIPVVAIYGPTDPVLWGVLGKNVTILSCHSRAMTDLKVETARDAVTSIISASS